MTDDTIEYEQRDVYEQSAVIPWKRIDGKLLVCMVTSRSGKRWIVPKGLIEPDMTPGESAAQEAWEEAGLRGEVSDEPVGHYSYKKWGGTCEVDVYLMRVKSEAETWLENEREKEWFSVSNAAKNAREKDLRKLIERLPDLLA